jgi:hypothetical protein
MAKFRRKGERVQAIPTDDWNEFVQTSRTVAQRQQGAMGAGFVRNGPSLKIEVFNTTAAPIAALFPVLKITPSHPMSDDRLNAAFLPMAFDGTTPDGETKISQIAILQGAVAENDSKPAAISGYTQVQVEWTDEAHTLVDVKSGDNTKLKSSTSGIKPVWHEEIPDAEYLPATLWAMVNLGGGGGSSANVTTKAVVTDAAGASTYDANGITGGTVGKGWLLDEDMQKISSDEEDKVEFKSLHFVGVPVGCIVELSSLNPIEAGSTYTENKVWGKIIASPYELAEFTGYGALKSLGVPEGGATAQDMQWLGVECEEET